MTTEKITLYDADNDILVEGYVSSTEAQRAATDTVFATELLNHLLQSKSKNNNEENMAGLSCNPTVNEIFTEEDPEEVSESRESEDSSFRWKPPCVLLLLETYKSLESTLNSGKMSQKKVWEVISKAQIEQGHNITGPQCYAKMRSLKKTYKAIKDHNNKSGNDRRSWPFFEIMDEIFAKKAWCSPVAVASSTGLSKQTESNQEEQAGESDSACSSKSSKTINVVSLLGKRLKQREEHEANKMKRHKERLEMDQKLLKVLEKIANK